ncbi:MAG TPA: ABC transporter ATP-binding protein [Bacteroidales bacterium]|nr:ABC transporter ATP-binding protein [Bacteroidales bacterium]HNS45941.1 ABC transporter ATP-binding protein [Bacteroidales bacterium]
MSETILSLQHLTKHYGRIHAVNDLSLEVNKGEVYGILGPNGSGKTTTLGMILDVVNPTSGTYSWFGQPPSHTHRKRIGSILEQPIFYPYLTPLQNLKIVSLIKEVPASNAEELLKMVGLYERRHSKFSTFSYGMRQRMALAASLLCNPEVLILDEPTNGLDPQGIAEVRELIRTVAARGVTIILASHLLDEVQKTCSSVCVLDKGKRLFAGNVEEVLRETILVEVAAADPAKLEQALAGSPLIKSVERQHDVLLIKLEENVTAGDLNAALHAQGIVLSHLVQRKKTLENYFLELLKTAE